MNIILLMLIFPFSLFVLLMSYWKEDKILHLIGSIAMMLTAATLLTGVQIPYSVIDGVGGVLTGNFNAVGVYEGYGIGLMLFVLNLVQMFYFSARFEFKREQDQ